MPQPATLAWHRNNKLNETIGSQTTICGRVIKRNKKSLTEKLVISVSDEGSTPTRHNNIRYDWLSHRTTSAGLHRTWTEHLDFEIAHLVGRLGSGPSLVGQVGPWVRVRFNFQKKHCPPPCRLGSGPRLVSRIGSGVQVRASFQDKTCPLRGSVRVRSTG